MFMDTNFASAFSFSQINAGIKLAVSQHPPVRTILPTCHCTHIDEIFIHCEQSQESERGLQQDVALTNQQTLSETVSETKISDEYEVHNTDEPSERRLHHFWNISGTEESSSTSTTKKVDNNVLITIKIHRLDIKKDLIKEFQEKQVSFKLIVQKFIRAYLTSDRWHLKRIFISSVICIN